jgi:hypothetical protein
MIDPDGPPFQPVNIIELDAVEDSRAEITRVFNLKLNVATGQNRLNISGLLGFLDNDSLR